MSDKFDNYYYDSQETNENNHFENDPLFDPEPAPAPAYKKTGRKSRRKASKLVATALAFGLIAGTTFYGTNTALHSLIGSGRQMGTVAKAGTSTEQTDLLSSSDTGALSTTGTAVSGTVADVAAAALPSLVTISCTTVEEMQDLYEYFGRGGMPDLGSIFGNMGGGIFGGGNSGFSGGSETGTAQEREISSCGTGVIIGQNEDELLIATNNHVVSGADTLSVGFVDETVISASVKGTDPNNDLAIVSVKIADIPQATLNSISVASIGDSDALSLGEQVVAIGNALGYGQSVTSGIISAFGRDLTLAGEDGGTMTSSGLIQTDASINAGNSGGGLFNMKGELIAINEAKSSSSSGQASVDNMGFAIPMAKALPILQNLMNGEEITQNSNGSNAYLGIRCSDVSEEASQMYGLPIGVSIVSVEEDSPAAACGLKTGDVITEFNAQTITTYNDLTAALSCCHAGDTVSINIYRSNEGDYYGQQISITLGERPNP